LFTIEGYLCAQIRRVFSLKFNQKQDGMVVPVLVSISLVHLLNDTMQSVVPAIYPLLYELYGFSYTQLGMLTFANHLVASLAQPFIGAYTDRHPQPFLLPTGLFFTMMGMFLLAWSEMYVGFVVAVMLVGVGSSIFHPEGSRIVSLSSGSGKALAQSIFQVGGNSGQALAPLIAVLVFLPLGQRGALWFTAVAALAVLISVFLSVWYKERIADLPQKSLSPSSLPKLLRSKIYVALALVMLGIFSRTWFSAGIKDFLALYHKNETGMGEIYGQNLTFVFLLSAAIGTMIGGPIADRFGLKNTIVFSLLVSVPAAISINFASGFWLPFALFAAGFTLYSTFSVSLIYTLQLLPGQVGKVAGLIFGVAFGLSSLGSMAWGMLADQIGLGNMLFWCSWVPFFGVFTFFMPSEKAVRNWYEATE
jgi:FSR family fosmidomycin resistance protein-like MFS transporter